MPSNQEDLLQLIRDTRNYVSHLQQLGIEAVEVKSTTVIERAPKQSTTTIPKREATLPEERRVAFVPAPFKSPETLFGDMAEPGERLCASTESFEDIHLEIGDCTRCPLHLKRT